jgi:1-acyl-sn-glycerol-3-phosphate acyltransferase
MSTKKKKKTIPRIEGDKKFRALLKGFFWLVGRIFYRFSYAGIENVPPEGAFILAANHTSIVDIIAIHTKLKRWLYWVARKNFLTRPLSVLLCPEWAQSLLTVTELI